MQQAKITKGTFASIQDTIDAAIVEDAEFADWLRRASKLGELIVRRDNVEYVLDLTKLKQNS